MWVMEDRGGLGGERTGGGDGEGELSRKEIGEWETQKRPGHRLLPKVAAGCHIKIEEMDLLQIFLCL